MRTARLVMRRWMPQDREPFAEMNADPEVMKHFPAPLDRAASDAFADRIEAGFAEHGFGLWAVERLDTQAFIGFVGLAVPRFDAHFTPTVEVGWRLARSSWGQGFATEAGLRAVAAGFDVFGLDQIVSFTATVNAPSIAVMRRLGMTHDPTEDFDHPSLPADHPLRRHVLYRPRSQGRIARYAWSAAHGSESRSPAR